MIRLFDQTYSDLPEDESADTEIPEMRTYKAETTEEGEVTETSSITSNQEVE